MSRIVLGDWTDGGPVRVDLARLIITRMLIQAESGGGKSWLLRRVLEVTAGHVQQIIIDPEGEFASLREKHDLIYVAGEGGDVLADPKTAGLLALRLLETRASAVIDLSEVKSDKWAPLVRRLCEAMIDAPKKLRHPLIFAVDEIQIFAPEKGQGESEALPAMIDMSTLGRKRGICVIGATQRVSMVNKNATGGLKNKLIGGTSADLDVKRAAFELGLTPKDALEQLRALDPGQFFAFGPALAQKLPRLMKVGGVETTHPEVGHHRRMALPAPSGVVKALLAQLADLPREAEEEARTIADFKREVAVLRRELTQAKRAQPAAPVAAKDDPAERRRNAATVKRLQSVIGELMKFIVKISATDFAQEAGVDPAELRKAIDSAVGQATKLIDARLAAREKTLQALQREGGRLVASAQKLLDEQVVRIDRERRLVFHLVAPSRTAPPRAPRAQTSGASTENPEIAGLGQRILNALAWLEAKGIAPAPRETVAAVAGVKPSGGYYARVVGNLKTEEYLSYPTAGLMALTDKGLGFADAGDESGEVHQQWLNILSGLEQKIVATLIENHASGPMSREDLANATNTDAGGGYFARVIGHLKTLGAVDYPQPKTVGLTSYVMPS